MSKDTAASKRYAKALYELANERGRAVQAEEDLKLIASALESSRELQTLLEHPSLQPDVKKSVLATLFAGKVTEEVENLLKLLVDRRREALLSTLAADYSKIAGESLGQAEAVVTTPFPLTDEESVEIAKQFGQKTGKKIKVVNVIDTNLLGGLTVRIGDMLYDGSLSGKLSRLRKTLVSSKAL
ncbi:F0F1 ATP synthase subunit delta [Gorillibacterium timonense]|uniref:F0F1 ATP synthase subunit delta n=1 Tax=Gorillibacterium timonense TaxID=1689269 RepID=UPI00071D2480|nr:F0F1 ATP synthase subunit delta [Gorillibacterium timonense]